jgi:hypothetical protein
VSPAPVRGDERLSGILKPKRATDVIHGTGPNPPALGIQPLTLDGKQHPIPEVNIELDTLVTAMPTPAGLSSGPYPAHFQGFINDPHSVLREAIEHQDILGHIEIHLTTDTLSADGKPTEGIGSLYETVSNIPFLGVATRTAPPPPGTSPAPSAFQAAPIPNAFVYSPVQPSGSNGCAIRGRRR